MSRERWDALLLLALGLALFGWLAPQAGLHLDDHGFWHCFEYYSPRQLFDFFVQYVPGRNLYILYFYALHRLAGGSPALMHVFGLVLDLLNPVLLLILARRMGASPGAALASAGLFLTWPNHGETHWWTSAIMMNLFSTTLTLCAVLAAGETRLSPAARLCVGVALYAAALFDYDQVYLLWILILAFARLRDPGIGAHRLTAAAAVFVALDALHLAARLFAPFSSGGRPMPRGGLVLLSLKHAVVQSLAPLRRPPALEDFPGGVAAAVAIGLLLGGCWAWRCARRWQPVGPQADAALAAFGAAWWACSYAPNMLWYISPRHNYLPSAGLALMAAALASRLSGRESARTPLALAGAGLFALFTLAAWSDGLAWSESSRLQDRFAAEAARHASPSPAVMLVGAPKELHTAPAFYHPHEHVATLGRFQGRLPPPGDVSIAPNRAGLFFGAQPQLGGDQAPPSFVSSATVFVYRDGGFARACSVRLDSPGLPPRVLKLGGNCPGVLALRAGSALVSSRSKGRGAPAADGPELESAWVEPGPGSTVEFLLRWRAGTASPDFATHAYLMDASGKELYRSSYQPSRREHEAFWPLYDDSRPSSSWKPGERIEQRYRLLLSRPLAAAPARLKLSLFTRRDGDTWAYAGKREASLSPP